jgi:hypothetical protein
VLVVTSGFAVIAANAEAVSPLANPAVVPVSIFNQARNVAHAIRRPERYAEAYDKSMARIRKQCELMQPVGRTDVYFASQIIVPAFGLDYFPRPVIQSYAAYSPSLLEMNAAHLSSPRAPESIVLRFEPIDERLPSQDDCLSWLGFIANYEPVWRSADTIMLERTEARRSVVLERVSEQWVRLGDDVEVPGSEDGLVWMEVHVSPTIAGRIANALVSPNELHIAIWQEGAPAGGRELRLIPEIARAGFLRSPHVTDVSGFERLFRSEPRHGVLDAVKSVSVRESVGPLGCYNQELRIVFYRVRVSASA